MSATDAAPWVVIAVAGVGAVASAWVQNRNARTAPASVADGYGKLVADLRADLDRVRREQVELRAKHIECLARSERYEHEIDALRRDVADLRAKVERPTTLRTRKDDQT